ncbi:MAG: insulinase family protein [Planctomycetota bacterium]|nr:insulinase family protein [Planctomycetota bacterium]
MLLRPVPGAGRVALVTLFGIGGDHDPQGRSGLAHFVEHLHVTAAAGTTPARTYGELVKRYAGQANAQTGFRYTVVAQVFPKGGLHAEILDAAARMRDLKITQADVDRERPRVLTELANMYERMSALAAANHARLLVRPTASGGRHGGTPADVERMTLLELRAFHAKYYKPRNAILVLVGEFDNGDARAAIEKAFANVPAGEAPPAPAHVALEVPQQVVRRPGPAAAPMVCLAFRAPAWDDDDFPAFLVLMMRLRAAGARWAPFDDPDVVYLQGPVRSDESDAQAAARLQGQVDLAATRKADAMEGFSAINTYGFWYGLTPVPDIAARNNLYGVAFALGRRAQLGVDGERLKKAFGNLSPDKIQAAAQAIFDPKRRSAVVVRQRKE